MELGQIILPMETGMYYLLLISVGLLLLVALLMLYHFWKKTNQRFIVYYVIHFVTLTASLCIWLYLFRGPKLPLDKMDEIYSLFIGIAGLIWTVSYVSLFIGLYKTFKK